MKEIKEVKYIYKKNGDIYKTKNNGNIVKISIIMHNNVPVYNKIIAPYKYKVCFAHRDIWKAFNGEIPKGKFVYHIDGDKLNNKLSNLKLGDMSKLLSNTIKKSVEKGKINNKKRVRCVQDGKVFESLKEASEYYNTDIKTLCNHLRNKLVKSKKNGKVYTYYIRTIKGYTFKYEGEK